MKIKAITQDQVIVIDGVAADANAFEGFEMRNGEWAVSYDTFTEIGEIEYIDRRPNKKIDKHIFENSYSWLIALHKKCISEDN